MAWGNPIVSLAATAALAVEIAEAIAEQGVSLLGAPTLLYNNSEPTPAGTPGLVGATISNSWFPSGTTEAQAISLMNGYVGLPLGDQVERVYYAEGTYPTTLTGQPLAAILAAGAKVQLCLKPQIAGLTNPTIAASEKTNIGNMITMFQDAGVEFDIVFWTECNIGGKFTSAAQYISLVALYGPTVIDAGVNLVYNPASFGETKPGESAADYYPGDALTSAITSDFYESDFDSGITLDAIAALADNHKPDPIPFGISEWNAHATSAESDWLTFIDYLISFFSARLANGLDNYDIILYAGTNAAGNQQILSASDYKIPGLVDLYNALSSAPPDTPGLVINGGGTKTVPPINPSPGGGYAMANGISYDITLDLVSNTTGNTNPFVTVQFNWYNVDAAGAQPVAVQHWNPPIGTTATAGTMTVGAGPQHGQYLQIKLVNRDTIACTATLQVNSTSRSEARHNWYWDAVAGVNVPGFTEANSGTAYTNSLISLTAASIPAADGDTPGSKSFLMSLFAGQVSVSFTTDGTNQLQFLLIPQPTSVLGGGAIYDETTVSDQRTIFLPRAPCLLQINNFNDSDVDAFAEVVIYD